MLTIYAGWGMRIEFADRSEGFLRHGIASRFVTAQVHRNASWR